MTHFRRRIADAAPGRDAGRRRWIYVAYDQLDQTALLLAKADPRQTVVALVESPAKARLRPYHRQKLALLLSNQRHFACELAERGFAVAWQVSDGIVEIQPGIPDVFSGSTQALILHAIIPDWVRFPNHSLNAAIGQDKGLNIKIENLNIDHVYL